MIRMSEHERLLDYDYDDYIQERTLALETIYSDINDIRDIFLSLDKLTSSQGYIC
jgi:hypothetical protein